MAVELIYVLDTVRYIQEVYKCAKALRQIMFLGRPLEGLQRKEEVVKGTKRLPQQRLVCYEALGLIICGFWLLSLGVVWAEIKLGPVQVHPGIEVEEVYRTNIYQTEKNERDDWITVISPSLSLNLPMRGRHEAHLGYSGLAYIYDRYGGEDHYDQIWDGHLFLDFPGGLATRLSGSITDATLERRPGVNRQREYNEYNTELSLEYAFAKRWQAKASYRYDEWDFEKDIDDRQSYTTNAGAVVMQYRILPRTWALLEGGYAENSYDEAGINDNDIYAVFLGLEWGPKGKLKGELKGGYAWKNYDRHRARRDNSPSDWSSQVGLTWDVDRRTSFKVTASRAFMDDIDYLNASYLSNIFRLGFQRRIYPKITFNIYGAYQRDEYTDKLIEPSTSIRKDREDESIRVGLGLRYDIQDYLFMGVKWYYEDEDSNFREYSYSENRLIIRLGVLY
ncbi:MAG: outer membrane beta-barrel protein [Deltaproteobacteria bacterium]|nr:outer membrane beta-barrel protein [Deltaproteobacteria bacterium]